MSDVENRANAYEKKLSHAIDTDPLMKGLVETVRRSRLVLRIASFGLLVDLVLSAILVFVVVDTHTTANRAEKNAALVSANNNKITKINKDACIDVRTANIKYNSLIDIIVTTNPRLSMFERSEYGSTRVPIKKC